MEETKIHTLPCYVQELTAAASLTWGTACVAGSSAITELLAHYSLQKETQIDREKFHKLRCNCSTNDYDIFVGVKSTTTLELMRAIGDVDNAKWEEFENIVKQKYDTNVKRLKEKKKSGTYQYKENGDVDYYLPEVLCVVPIKVTTDIDQHKTESKKIDVVFVDLDDCKESFEWSNFLYGIFDIDIASVAIKMMYGENKNRIINEIDINPSAEENLKMARLHFRVQRHANFQRMLFRMMKYRNKGFNIADITFDEACRGEFEKAANEYIAHVFQNELVKIADKEKYLPQDAQRKIANFLHIPDMTKWEKDVRINLMVEEVTKKEDNPQKFLALKDDPFKVFSYQIQVRAAKVITRLFKKIIKMKREERIQQSKRKLDEVLEQMWYKTRNEAK